jgi:hypothetical protein
MPVLDFNDKTRSVRGQWARHHATVPIKAKLNSLQSLPGRLDGILTGPLGEDDPLPPAPMLKLGKGDAMLANPAVAIVGAGAAGLFTAMILDYLNETCKDAGFNASYDIYEASVTTETGNTRIGGRLYTHNFPGLSDARHNYYDVGAMRFPEPPSDQQPGNPIMTR